MLYWFQQTKAHASSKGGRYFVRTNCFSSRPPRPPPAADRRPGAPRRGVCRHRLRPRPALDRAGAAGGTEGLRLRHQARSPAGRAEEHRAGRFHRPAADPTDRRAGRAGGLRADRHHHRGHGRGGHRRHSGAGCLFAEPRPAPDSAAAVAGKRPARLSCRKRLCCTERGGGALGQICLCGDDRPVHRSAPDLNRDGALLRPAAPKLHARSLRKDAPHRKLSGRVLQGLFCPR